MSPLERNCKRLAVFNEVAAAAAARSNDGAGVCQEDIVWLGIIKHPEFFFFSVPANFFFPPSSLLLVWLQIHGTLLSRRY